MIVMGSWLMWTRNASAAAIIASTLLKKTWSMTEHFSQPISLRSD